MLPKSIQKLKFYVNDFSKVLSKNTQTTLDSLFQSIDNDSSTQVVTVLFPHREGKELRDIALEVFNSNGIGQKGKNNGLLLIIATDEKKIRIMTGKGLEWIYNESWCKRVITQKLRPLLNQGKYEELIQLWYEEVQKKLISFGKSPLKRLYAANKHIRYSVHLAGIIVFIWSIIKISPLILFSLWLCFLLFLFIRFRKEKGIIGGIIGLLILGIFVFGTVGYIKYCNENPTRCESSSSSNSSSSYNSSSSSDWGSSSSSSWGSSSSSSFGGGGGSSNGGGWGD